MIIDKTEFGSIEIDNKKYGHDVIVLVDGQILNRYNDFKGTSHILGEDEAKKIARGEPEIIFVGSGQYGILTLDPKAEDFFKKKKIKISIDITPTIVEEFNRSGMKKAALFHVTC